MAVTMLASSVSVDEPPRVAFAVSRKVGTAVVRNRLRRQVRAHLGELRAAKSPLLPAGAWLFALQPGAAEAERSVLLADVESCLGRLVGSSQ